MNGSPPFSRTTRRPARACSSISSWMRPCADGVAAAPSCRPQMRSASRRASASTSSRDEPVVQDHVGLLQRPQRVQRQQARVARAGADQRDRTASWRLAPVSSVAFELRAPHLPCSGAHSALRLAAHDRLVEAAARARRPATPALMRERQRSSSAASAPNDSSISASMRSRTSRASTGATPPRRYGDHERRAIDDGRHDEARRAPRSSTTLTSTLRSRAGRGDRGVDGAIVGRGDREDRAVEVPVDELRCESSPSMPRPDRARLSSRRGARRADLSPARRQLGRDDATRRPPRAAAAPCARPPRRRRPPARAGRAGRRTAGK